MMGQSGGRSAEHPSGRGAVARSTPRQRDLVDPPPGFDHEEVGGRHRDGERVDSSLQTVWLYLVMALVASGWMVGCAFLGAWVALNLW